MSKTRKAFIVDMPDGRAVTMAMLRTGELRLAMQKAGNIKVEDARRFEQGLHGLRAAIREIDGAEVKEMDLAGDKLDDHFDAPEIQMLVAAWHQIHSPSEEAVEGLGESIRAVSGD